MWCLLLILAAATSNSIVAAVAVFFTGVLPFIFIALWLSLSETGTSIRSHFKRWHFTLIFTWILFAYTIYARKWAASLINEIFHIDASSLGITYTLLAALYTPFGIFYQEAVVSALWNAIILIAVVWGGLFPFMLFLPIKLGKVARFFGVSILVILLSSVFIATVANLSLNKKNLISEFAIWADFNSSNLCSDDWTKNAQSVVFLGGDRVLAYKPANPTGSRFVPETCNYSKTL